jgi:hypothetical protein
MRHEGQFAARNVVTVIDESLSRQSHWARTLWRDVNLARRQVRWSLFSHGLHHSQAWHDVDDLSDLLRFRLVQIGSYRLGLLCTNLLLTEVIAVFESADRVGPWR